MPVATVFSKCLIYDSQIGHAITKQWLSAITLEFAYKKESLSIHFWSLWASVLLPELFTSSILYIDKAIFLFIDEIHYRLTASCSIFSRKHILVIESILPYLACVKIIIITARYLIIKQIILVETSKIIYSYTE